MDAKCPHGIHTDLFCEPCEVEASQDAETCHALAVLGARVLAAFIDGDDALESDPLAFVGEAASELDIIGGAFEDDDEYHYATPAIAATVAQLTEGDGNG